MNGYFAALAERSGISSGGRGPRAGDSGPSGAFAGEESARAGLVEESVEVVARPHAPESDPRSIRELEWAGDRAMESTRSAAAMEAMEPVKQATTERSGDSIATEALERVMGRHVEASSAESETAPRDTLAPPESFIEAHVQREARVEERPAMNPKARETGGESDRSRVWLETFHTVREWVAGTPGEPKMEAEEVRTAWPEPSAETGRPLPERAPRSPIVERFEERAAPPEVRVSVGTISIVVEEPQSSPPPTREARRPIERQDPPPADWTRLRRRYIR